MAAWLGLVFALLDESIDLLNPLTLQRRFILGKLHVANYALLLFLQVLLPGLLLDLSYVLHLSTVLRLLLLLFFPIQASHNHLAVFLLNLA